MVLENLISIADCHPQESRPGMKLLHVWVPDTNSPEFIAEAHRQSLLIANSPGEQDDIDFIESISELP